MTREPIDSMAVHDAAVLAAHGQFRADYDRQPDPTEIWALRIGVRHGIATYQEALISQYKAQLKELGVDCE